MSKKTYVRFRFFIDANAFDLAQEQASRLYGLWITAQTETYVDIADNGGRTTVAQVNEWLQAILAAASLPERKVGYQFAEVSDTEIRCGAMIVSATTVESFAVGEWLTASLG